MHHTLGCEINSIVCGDHAYCDCDCHDSLPAVQPSRVRNKWMHVRLHGVKRVFFFFKRHIYIEYDVKFLNDKSPDYLDDWLQLTHDINPKQWQGYTFELVSAMPKGE